MTLYFEPKKGQENSRSKSRENVLDTTEEDETDETTELIQKNIDLGISEKETQAKLNLIADCVARVARLERDNVQCQYVLFSHRGFQCKVCVLF